jgi:hypothetical protein
MAYGTIKVNNITFDNGGSDQNVTVSGLYNSLTSGITVTGTISGAVVIGSTSVSGTTVQGASGTFTSLTGTTIQGTTATYTTGSFTSLTGTTTTGTTANFVSGVFSTRVSGTTVIATTGTFTSLTGTTTQGTTATYTTGSFTSLTGTTTTGTTSSFTSGVFTTLSGATATFTSGIIASGTAAAPSLAILGDLNTGIFSPGANQLAVATNGVGRLFVDASGHVGVGTSSISTLLHLSGSSTSSLIRIESTSVGASSFNGAGAGLDLIGGNSNTSAKYMPAIKFGSADSDFTTTTPKYGASITAEASENYNSDTSGGMHLAFWTSPNSPGTGSGLQERLRIDSGGRLLVGTSSDSGGALLQVNGDRIRVGTAKTPATSGATGTTGEIAWDADYIYVCTATNTWKRSAIATW